MSNLKLSLLQFLIHSTIPNEAIIAQEKDHKASNQLPYVRATKSVSKLAFEQHLNKKVVLRKEQA